QPVPARPAVPAAASRRDRTAARAPSGADVRAGAVAGGGGRRHRLAAAVAEPAAAGQHRMDRTAAAGARGPRPGTGPPPLTPRGLAARPASAQDAAHG